MRVACQLGVFTGPLDTGALPTLLTSLAVLGYESVVLPPLEAADIDVIALRGQFEDAGLSPITIAVQTPDEDVSSADAAVRRRGADRLRRTLELTWMLGGDQLNGVPYGPFGRAATLPDDGAFERSALLVGEVADLAFEQGVAMTFEVVNRYETPLINTAEQAVRYVEASGSTHLGIHLDTFHMGVEEVDQLAAVRLAAPYLGFLEFGQPGRGALGGGQLDVASVLALAVELGYRGRFGYEAFSRPVLGADAADGLAIWRDTFADPLAAAGEAIEILRGAA